MERTAWTDERLDDTMKAIDTSFENVRASHVDLRKELVELRADMRQGFAEVRAEMREGFAELRRELIALHVQSTRIFAAFTVGLLGVLGVSGAAQL